MGKFNKKISKLKNIFLKEDIFFRIFVYLTKKVQIIAIYVNADKLII